MYRKTIILATLIMSMFSLDVIAGVKHKHIIKNKHNIVKTKEQTSNTPVECLAKTIYYEARGESEEGKKWVAYSVINRTKHPKFPKDICSVVSERHNGVCQFSWVCKGSKIRRDDSWDHCVKVAMEVMNSTTRNSKFDKILYFHSITARPSWGRKYKKIARVDKHVFYGES